MAGIVNKVKDMMHKDKDATHTDPTHSSHTTGTHGTHGTANPLDRNNDGTMNARDLTGGGQHAGTGLGHNTASHGTANPLDRNNDGTMNARDLTGGGQHAGTGLAGHSAGTHGTTSHATHGTALTGALNGPLDASGPHNTRAANVLDPHVSTGHSGTTGGIGHNTVGHGTHGTSNPLDRNNDGRMNAGDLTGHSGTTGGIGHNTAGHGTHGTSNPLDRNNDGRMNAGDLTGHSGTTGGIGHNTAGHGTHGTSNPLDRNNDGRMNAGDLTGHSSTGAYGAGHSGAGGLTSHTAGGLDHRAGETGELPLALTEDVSRAENHGQAGHGHHTTGTNTTHAKPSLKDKLNPKVDADGDGKAGFMK